MLTGRKIIVVTIFAVAMAFLETAVVIYIRELLYPEGFAFPLVQMNPDLALIEILREAATLIMLLTLGWLAGRSLAERFSWFIYAFAIWDIFYYVFLWLLVGWPQNLMTWDILFLIPVTWTGPVLTPLLVCVLMIILSLGLLIFSKQDGRVSLLRLEWVFLLLGSVIVVIAFSWDYSRFILDSYSVKDLFNLPGPESLFDLATTYIPRSFNWLIFLWGYLVILITEFFIFYRLYKMKKARD